ncbi:MAG: DUF3109 family protein [Bacteroidales bacterium]|jgi:hypothetical protein|nr:DUF3109 family protein [Bacteroidales bacterium]
MFQIGNAIVSRDIFEKKFVCDLRKCKGLCCVQGDSGAPLEEEEIAVLEEILPAVKPYMTSEGLAIVEKEGVFVTDSDGDKVTPLVGSKEDCVYSFYRKGCAYCAIEKAYNERKINFQKPVSCHLYPIRITRYTDFEAVNYHQWQICRDALATGEKTGTPLYVFLKEPLIRKYGKEWYEELLLFKEQYDQF